MVTVMKIISNVDDDGMIGIDSDEVSEWMIDGSDDNGWWCNGGL